jgi:hypothetical protein
MPSWIGEGVLIPLPEGLVGDGFIAVVDFAVFVVLDGCALVDTSTVPEGLVAEGSLSVTLPTMQ